MCGNLPAASTMLTSSPKGLGGSDKLRAGFGSLVISVHSFHVNKIPDKDNAVVALEPAIAGGTTAPWAPAGTP